VRIAVSGAHATGKTTLLAELHGRLNQYELVEEPYYELLDEGHDFSDPPSAEDIVPQLERSLARLNGAPGRDVLFDRSPLDFLAYLIALDGPDAAREWIPEVEEALAHLDLIVFVPIERPDRIAAAEAHDRLRTEVDRLLHDIVFDDSFGLGTRHVHVSGSVEARVDQVLRAVTTFS
jgi:predicted ATPase